MSLCCNYKLGKEIRSDTDFHSEDLWTGESRDKFKVWGVQEPSVLCQNVSLCIFLDMRVPNSHQVFKEISDPKTFRNHRSLRRF